MEGIKIDLEFQRLIPPLSDEERDQLEANLVQDGCRDPLVVWGQLLLDGHNRFEICSRLGIPYRVEALAGTQDWTRDDAEVWIIENQFGRRNLANYVRGELAMRLKDLYAAQAKERQRLSPGAPKGVATLPHLSTMFDGGEGAELVRVPAPASMVTAFMGSRTRQHLADIAGVSDGTMAKIEFIAKHAPEPLKQELRKTDGPSIHRVFRQIKEEKQREERNEKRKEAALGLEVDTRIIVGDFRDHAHRIPNGTVDLIFTDPPYDREASKMLPDLARFANDKLVDGGSLICYVGQTQIPAAIDAFRQHLRYWWVLCCLHEGGHNLMREYGIRVGWKAVLWFVKGTRHDVNNIVTDVMSGGQEKAHHDWQQSQSEAEYWIRNLCPTDGLVCDPFLGGGTTAAAAKAIGREWIGFEIDADTAAVAGARVAV